MAKIVTMRALQQFWSRHNRSEEYLKEWYDTAKKATWNTPQQVLSAYPTASILKDGRVVFNIKGNSYRLVIWINYRRNWIYVRFVGTHSEYDKINANTV